MRPETIERIQNHILVRTLRQYSIWILAAVVAGVLVRSFIIEAYRIPTSVMQPTLRPGDLIFVAKWPFGLRVSKNSEPLIPGRKPAHGEVVTYIRDEEPDHAYIKRIIGLGGDSIEIREGLVGINGEPLALNLGEDNECGEESNRGRTYSICLRPPLLDDLGPVKVPEGKAFVIGDLRSKYTSKREWDLIPLHALRAKPIWIWLSVDPSQPDEDDEDVASLFPSLRLGRILRSIE